MELSAYQKSQISSLAGFLARWPMEYKAAFSITRNECSNSGMMLQMIKVIEAEYERAFFALETKEDIKSTKKKAFMQKLIEALEKEYAQDLACMFFCDSVKGLI